MGTLNSRLHEVHIPIAGIALSHLTTLRVRFATGSLSGNGGARGFLLSGSGL
jgi:hypothetical protein